MNQHLSFDFDQAPTAPVKTRADLCQIITDTSDLDRRAEITFTLFRGELRSVGVEAAL